MSTSATIVATGEGAINAPTEKLSVARTSGTWDGEILIQSSIPSKNQWLTECKLTGKMSVPLVTPDASVDYRWVAVINSGTANFYFGP